MQTVVKVVEYIYMQMVDKWKLYDSDGNMK